MSGFPRFRYSVFIIFTDIIIFMSCLNNFISFIITDSSISIRYYVFCLQVMTALGKIWHPEHFQCAHCNVELGTQNFFERDGLPYCEKDYHQLFSPMCAACGGPILDVSESFKTTYICTTLETT